MSSLVDVRTAMVTALRADSRLAGVNVSTHGGDFTLAELLRYGGKGCPALVLALLRFKPQDNGGLIVAEATWGLVAMTKDAVAPEVIDPPTAARTIRRDESVIDLADKASRCILRLFAGTDATVVGRPQEMICQNEFAEKLDREGIAMWGMQFGQLIDLQEESDSSVPFDLLHAEWDLVPLSQPADELGDQIEAEDDIVIVQDP